MVPELIYRGLDRCDACGAPLPPSDQLAGFCEACQATVTPHRSRRGKRERRKATQGGKRHVATPGKR